MLIEQVAYWFYLGWIGVAGTLDAALPALPIFSFGPFISFVASWDDVLPVSFSLQAAGAYVAISAALGVAGIYFKVKEAIPFL